MTVKEALASINAYPIPDNALCSIAQGRGLDINDETDAYIIGGDTFRLAKADVLQWLSIAPNVSQGGQSYSFTEDERTALRAAAQQIYEEIASDLNTKPRFGYKGSTL